MILVISTSHSYEQGSEAVIEWLSYFNAKFLKISLEDIYTGQTEVHLDIYKREIVINGIDLLKDINIVFFRKAEIFDVKSKHVRLSRELNNEKKSIIDHIFYSLKSKVWFPQYSPIIENKIISLDIAQRNNIKIPQTLITNKKEDVIKFKDEFGMIINKPINFCGYYYKNDNVYTGNTIIFDEKKIHHLPGIFPLSLFQEYLSSDYELRCFFLDNEIYSTAIFTQEKYIRI